METKPRVTKILKEWTGKEFLNITKEKSSTRNHAYSLKDPGDLGEELCLEMFPNSIGSGSKGGCAYDNRQRDTDGNVVFAREVKFCILNGSKNCKNAECNKEAAPYFQKNCCKCGGNDFTKNNDSRCGISAKSHIKYYVEHTNNFLKEYILFSCKFNEDKEYFNIRAYKILSGNEYFEDYIDNQHKNGSGDTCNLLPYSIDFHLSGPIKLFDFEFYKDHEVNNMFNIENTESEDIPFKNWNSFSQLGYKYKDGQAPSNFNEDSPLNYTENIALFKKKTDRQNQHGRSRGVTSRNQ
jgi:hypothetical protein